MAKTIDTDKGPITLYNPSERAKKFCDDLKTKTHTKGKRKDEPLSPTEAAWRSGYLAARKESAKIWKKKQEKKAKKKTSSKKNRTSIPVTSEYGEPND